MLLAAMSSPMCTLRLVTRRRQRRQRCSMVGVPCLLCNIWDLLGQRFNSQHSGIHPSYRPVPSQRHSRWQPAIMVRLSRPNTCPLPARPHRRGRNRHPGPVTSPWHRHRLVWTIPLLGRPAAASVSHQHCRTALLTRRAVCQGLRTMHHLL